MKITITESGLVVPDTPPPEPTHRYTSLEIKDANKREQAIEAMTLLRKALDLHKGCGNYDTLCGHSANPTHYKMWHFWGEMMLGPDLPSFEEWC